MSREFLGIVQKYNGEVIFMIPEKLKPGDEIRVIAPSNSLGNQDEREFIENKGYLIINEGTAEGES